MTEELPRPAPSRVALAFRFIACLGIVAGSAWLASRVTLGDKSGAAPLIFMACLGSGVVAGFHTVQSAFRLGRSMRPGYDPHPAEHPTPNLLWESVKTLAGMGGFLLKLLVGTFLWICFIFLFERV